MENHDVPTRGVIVLYSVSQRRHRGEPGDLIADTSTALCADAIASALESLGCSVRILPIRGELEGALQPYPPARWAVFNLAEGSDGRLFEEVRIALALEALGYTFTGARGLALAHSTNKALAKELLARAGIPTPAWRIYSDSDQVQAEYAGGAGPLPFPQIVKPVAEDASIGIGLGAVVHAPDELRQRVAYILSTYRQLALAEEFIPGREFNVSLWGRPAQVLPLAEIDFSAFEDPYQQIVTFAAKWDDDSHEYHNTPVRCPADLPQDVAGRINAVVLSAWNAVGGSGYGRVDIRLSVAGVPYVMEVNGNPDLSPDAGFFRAARAAGYDYPRMVARILHDAGYPITHSTDERV